MKLLNCAALAAVLVLSLCAPVDAAPTWTEGVNYFLIVPARPTSLPAGKVEVTEVFSYACPACNVFVPTIHKLKASLPRISSVKLMNMQLRLHITLNDAHGCTKVLMSAAMDGTAWRLYSLPDLPAVAWVAAFMNPMLAMLQLFPTLTLGSVLSYRCVEVKRGRCGDQGRNSQRS